MKGFKQCFGYTNEAMAKRLYMYLSSYKPKARVTFETFARRMFKMIYGDAADKSKIAFNFYDYDGNGAINSLDIYELVKYYEEGSKLHQEAEVLVKDITDSLVRHRGRSDCV